MVTKLQKAVEIVENRHADDKNMNKYSVTYRQHRGTVLNATPAEIDMIRRISIPMDESDYKAHTNGGGSRKAYWEEWLNAN